VGVAPGLNPSIATKIVSKGILGHLLKFQLMLIKESAVITGQRVRDMCTATHILPQTYRQEYTSHIVIK
jgi:hypothetical protein